MTRTRFASAAAALLAAVSFVHPAAADPPRQEPVAHWNTVAAQACAPTEGTQPLPRSHLRDHARHPRRAERHRPPLRALHVRPGRGAGRVDRRRSRHRRARSAGDADPRAGRARRRGLLPHRSSSRGTGEGGGDRRRPRLPQANARTTARRTASTPRRSRSTSRKPPPATTSSRRRSISRSCPDGAASSRLRSRSRITGWTVRCRSTSRRYARPRPPALDRRARQHHADGGTIDDREVLVRGLAAGVEPDRQHVVRQNGLDSCSAARAFALVNFALADGYIAGFEAKYHFRFWRPVTAIRAAGDDGNPHTADRRGSRSSPRRRCPTIRRRTRWSAPPPRRS